MNEDESSMSASLRLMNVARQLVTELISYRGSFMAFRKETNELLVLSRSKEVKSLMAKLGLTQVRK